jgi:hypothetical protein
MMRVGCVRSGIGLSTQRAHLALVRISREGRHLHTCGEEKG